MEEFGYDEAEGIPEEDIAYGSSLLIIPYGILSPSTYNIPNCNGLILALNLLNAYNKKELLSTYGSLIQIRTKQGYDIVGSNSAMEKYFDQIIVREEGDRVYLDHVIPEKTMTKFQPYMKRNAKGFCCVNWNYDYECMFLRRLEYIHDRCVNERYPFVTLMESLRLPSNVMLLQDDFIESRIHYSLSSFQKKCLRELRDVVIPQYTH